MDELKLLLIQHIDIESQIRAITSKMPKDNRNPLLQAIRFYNIGMLSEQGLLDAINFLESQNSNE